MLMARVLIAVCQGTYITVEEGTASFTPSSTAPVVTSTLPAAQTSSSASVTAPPSASTTGKTQQNNAAGSAFAPLSSVLLAAAFGLGYVLL